jgi:hypothetical protein
MTNFPSSALPTPTASADDGNPQMTVAVQFAVSQPTAIWGGRWFATADTAGVTVYAMLCTWTGSGPITMTSTLATSATVTAAAGWNDLPFASEVTVSLGVDYALLVVQPSSSKYTYVSNAFPKSVAPFAQATVISGAFHYGLPSSPLVLSTSWYGVDVVSGLGSQFGASEATVTDTVAVTRGGLPTTMTVSASATDALGATAASSLVVPVSTETTVLDVGVHYLHKNRVQFNSLADSERQGPAGSSVATDEVGNRFTVQRTCTLTGCRIYKHPAASGSIPLTVWDYGTGTALTTTTLSWVADSGGWVEFDLPTPVSLVPGVEYCVSFFPNAYVYTGYRFNGQNYLEWPFRVQGSIAPGETHWMASACCLEGAHGFPNVSNVSMWYWIDPRVEYELPTATYKGGLEYMRQWPGWDVDFFPISVFAVDAGGPGGPGGHFQAYKDMGVNLPLPYDLSRARNEIIAANVAFICSAQETTAGVQMVLTDPPLAALCKAYNYWDEPDMQGGSGASAETLRNNFVAVRKLDSSRPLYFGFGAFLLQGQSYAWYPNGASVEYVTNMWREQIELTDLGSADDYTMTGGQGIWQYGMQMDRLRDATDGRVPLMVAIETCIQVGGIHNPTVDECKRAAMLSIIHGARWIDWFDHQFAYNAPDGTYYPNDFQAMLHDPVKKAGFTAFHAFLQTIKEALWAPEAGLLTSVSSSNKTAGPIGGVLGVPIDCTTRLGVAGKKHLLAQAGRPGMTTGTFTIPSAPSKTLTVLDESRTVTTNGSGVFTDTFGSDYEYHVYEWT